MTTTVTRRRPRSRKVKALLAGGLVLGIGAAITLAAWNDSEFATGTFAAGTFNLQGSSTDGTTFTDHATSPGAALNFQVNPSALSPGDVVYAPFAVRLAADTTNDAAVTVSNTTTGTVSNLTYTLIAPDAWGCASDTTGTALVPAATAVDTVPDPTTFNLTKGSPTTDPGATEFLCFKVTAGAVTQGQSGTVTWQFLASSTP